MIKSTKHILYFFHAFLIETYFTEQAIRQNTHCTQAKQKTNSDLKLWGMQTLKVRFSTSITLMDLHHSYKKKSFWSFVKFSSLKVDTKDIQKVCFIISLSLKIENFNTTTINGIN